MAGTEMRWRKFEGWNLLQLGSVIVLTMFSTIDSQET